MCETEWTSLCETTRTKFSVGLNSLVYYSGRIIKQSLFGQVHLRLNKSHLCDSKIEIFSVSHLKSRWACKWFNVLVLLFLPKSYEFDDVTIKGDLESKKCGLMVPLMVLVKGPTNVFHLLLIIFKIKLPQIKYLLYTQILY